jgi:hypothetical protein
LNIDFGINNERQDCKAGTVCWEDACMGMNGEDEDEGRGSIDFIYIRKVER